MVLTVQLDAAMTGGDSDDSVERSDFCPWCEYALTGLPDRYRCPECGRDYDRAWRYFGIYGGFFRETGRVLTSRRPLGQARWLWIVLFLLVSPALVVLSFVGFLIYRRSQRRRFVIVGSGRMRAFRHEQLLQEFDLREVLSVSVEGGYVRIVLSDRSSPEKIDLWRVEEAEDCKAAIEQWLNQYHQDNTSREA